MDILRKLKSEKKDKENLLSSILQKKEGADDKAKTQPDPEITQINKPVLEEKRSVLREDRLVAKPKTFTTEGMREFDLESLKADDIANMRIEYARRIESLVVEGKLDDAAALINELRERLKQK